MRVAKRRIRGKWSTCYYAWVPKQGGGVRFVSTHCADFEAAKRRARELERGAVSPQPVPGLTTKAACERFLESRLNIGRSDETIRFYTPKLANLIDGLPERLDDVDAKACEDYISARLKEVSRATIKKELRALMTVLRHAKRSGLYGGDPMGIIPEFEGREVSRKRVLADMEELQALLGELSETHARMVRSMVAFGLRKAERVMPVSETVVRITGTKTDAASDDVPTVRPWQRLLRKQGTAPAIRWANATRDLERACERAGIEKVTPNDLRRTLATWLNRDGVPRWAISRILRHKSGRMVDMHYAKPTLDDVAKAMR